jgi:hypothetical protein
VIGVAYQPPMVDPAPSTPLSPAEIDLLNSAFAMAPVWLQTALCRNVDFVYVDQDDQAPYGWSYWEEAVLFQYAPLANPPNNGPGSGHGVFIAINRKVLDDTTASGDSLAKLGLQILFASTFGNGTSAPPQALAQGKIVVDQIITDIPTPDDGQGNSARAEGLLFLLAREMGFVTEHELVVQGGTLPYLTCAVDGKSTMFYDQSWQGYNNWKPEYDNTHAIGSQRHDRATPKNPPLPPTANQIVTDAGQYAPPAIPANAISAMKQVYGTSTGFQPEWVDLLAAQAPIEDFVETYALDVMWKATDPKVVNGNNTLMTGFHVLFTDNTSSWDPIAHPPENDLQGILRAKMKCLNDPTYGLIVQLQPLP